MDSPELLLADPPLRALHRDRVTGRAVGGSLRSLKIKLLSSCNLRCEMCDYWRIERVALLVELVEGALDDAAALGCRKVHLSGGEVTLYPDLERVLRHGVRAGLRVNLTTNGVELDRPTVRAWVAARVHAVSISFDGARAETHDAIRGVSGAFDRSVKGARRLMREAERGGKLRLRINTVLQRRNLGEMPALIRLAVELGACDVVPMPIDGEGADRPTAEEIRHYNATIAPEVEALRQRFGMPAGADRVYPFGTDLAASARGDYANGYYARHLCHAPWLHAFISHKGEAFACCMTNERMPPLGNLHTQPLAAIWTGPPYERFRTEMRSRRLEMCGRCDQFLPENRALNDGLGLAPGPAPTRFSLPLIPRVTA